MKRTVSLILAVLLLLPLFAGCSKGGGDSETKPVTSDAPTVKEEAAEEDGEPEETDVHSRYKVPDDLPDGLDFGGESMRILHRDWDLTTWEIYVEEDTGEVLYSAIFNRNIKVEDRLNLRIVPTSTPDQQSTLRATVAAHSDEFDMTGGYRAFAMVMATEGILRNLYNIDYVDTEKPWWSQSFLDAATIDDKRFFLTGDGALSMLWAMGCMFVNHNLYEQYIGSVQDLWQLVMDGKWTYDLLGEYAEKVYTDTNGNGVKDKGDVYGFASETYSALDFLLTSADVHWSEKDADGIPQLTINNEHTVSFVEKLYKLLYENKGTYAATYENGFMGANAANFTKDELMFTFGYSSSAGDFREMESDYSVVAFPKYDENQDSYKTYVHDVMSVFCVPTTNRDHWEMTGAFLEAFFSESYRTVTDAYYETLLKQKYARDPIVADMLDLIKSCISFDFVMCNSSAMMNCQQLFWNLLSKGNYDFASAYAKGEKSLQKKLDALIEFYKSYEE